METHRTGDELRSTPPAATGWEARLAILEARVDHLESAHEGLQDAVYRQAVLEDEKFGELRRRTEPEQMVRDLRDARARGL